MQKTISIQISGRVQGVYYRQSTLQYAVKYQLSGTVKNNPDGTVFIVVTGTSQQLTDFIEWCKKGPPRAVVTNVQVTELPYCGFSDFSIIR